MKICAYCGCGYEGAAACPRCGRAPGRVRFSMGAGSAAAVLAVAAPEGALAMDAIPGRLPVSGAPVTRAMSAIEATLGRPAARGALSREGTARMPSPARAAAAPAKAHPVKHCGYCGRALKPGMAFCGYCGHVVATPAPIEPDIDAARGAPPRLLAVERTDRPEETPLRREVPSIFEEAAPAESVAAPRPSAAGGTIGPAAAGPVAVGARGTARGASARASTAEKPEFCEACWHVLRPGAAFCPSCGTPVRAEGSPDGLRCAACGHALLPEDRFCLACGHPVNADADESEATAGGHRLRLWLIIAAVVLALAVLGVGGYLLLSGSQRGAGLTEFAADRDSLVLGEEAEVQFSVRSRPGQSGIALIDRNGAQAGLLLDDGMNGDAMAGDGIYTGRIPVKPMTIESLSYRARSGHKDSDAVTIHVYPRIGFGD